MKAIINQIRNYVFVPSGESIRAIEVAVTWAIVRTLTTQDWSTLGNWTTYVGAALAAGLVAGIAVVKGLLPPAGTSS